MIKNQVTFRTLDENGWAVVRPLLCQSCIRVFASYGLCLVDSQRSAQRSDLNQSLAAIIGFTGAQMRGALTLITTPDLLRRAPPYREAPEMSRDKQLGWLGELSNQALGHIKHLLLDYGVSLDLSLPEIMLGKRLKPGLDRPMVSFDAAGGGVLDLHFHADLSPEITLRYNPMSKDDQPMEGELIFL